ncbi:MAG: hypothetical protein JWN14_697, partial [Chthonomonadales bacterium]|nr:hypothetical protein [Chthonomonadales bacterium]
EIDTHLAEITSLRYRDHEFVSNTGRHRNIYFSRDGGTSFEKLSDCRATLAGPSSEGVDLACTHTYSPKRDKHAWNVEAHFVVRRGVPGVYVYANVSHPASYPELSIGEFRMVWSQPGGAGELEKIFVDEARPHVEASQAELAGAIPVPGGPKEVTELITGPLKGQYDCKYMFSAEYANLGCWGFASDAQKLGAWIVLPSHEFFNDGPNKQDLTASVGTTLLHLNMNHYDGTGMHFAAGQAWEKMYGPWLIYLNDKPTADACWKDAQQQAQREAIQWPYAWVKHPNYPLSTARGGVKGTFVVRDSLKPGLTSAGAWIGLAAPEAGAHSDFQFQATGYQYWTRVGPDGAFTIPNVRPGEYTLYAYVTGAVGQFSKTSITVAAGAGRDLAAVTWNVPHFGSKIAWEIGVPDRSAAEFRHGQDYFVPMLFARLPAETPDPLEYTIGKSDPSRDWWYAQSRSAKGQEFKPQRWRVHFRLDRAPPGDATLVLAFAGADRARLSLQVNEEQGAGQKIVPDVQGGNGLVREAVHTKYSVSMVKIPAAQLRAGENTITLVQENIRDAASYVMYDYLRLELP